tara:strand:+ start:701 stop:1303 length:603 start_codon:yes stop_codon:yes gene_type:complete
MANENFTTKLQKFENDLVEKCTEVTNHLLPFSPEGDYQLALKHELSSLKYDLLTEVVTAKKYKKDVLDCGKYDRMDLVVKVAGRRIILELKSVDAIKDKHRLQLLNYLYGEDLPGYLINFQEKDGNVCIEKLTYDRHEPILHKWYIDKSAETMFFFDKEGSKEFSKTELVGLCELLQLPHMQSKFELVNAIKAKITPACS